MSKIVCWSRGGIGVGNEIFLNSVQKIWLYHTYAPCHHYVIFRY